MKTYMIIFENHEFRIKAHGITMKEDMCTLYRHTKDDIALTVAYFPFSKVYMIVEEESLLK
jgi:hypothetical protein